MVSAKALLQENHMTGGAEMETLTEQSVPQYTARNIKIVKQQVAWCSVRKLQAMGNSAKEVSFNFHAVNGVFVPECNSKETVSCAASLENSSRSSKFGVISKELIRVK